MYGCCAVVCQPFCKSFMGFSTGHFTYFTNFWTSTTSISPNGGIKILVIVPLNQVKVTFQDAASNLISSVFRLLLMISIGEFHVLVRCRPGPSKHKEGARSIPAMLQDVLHASWQREKAFGKKEHATKSMPLITHTHPCYSNHKKVRFFNRSAAHGSCWSKFTLKISENVHEFQCKLFQPSAAPADFPPLSPSQLAVIAPHHPQLLL